HALFELLSGDSRARSRHGALTGASTAAGGAPAHGLRGLGAVAAATPAHGQGLRLRLELGGLGLGLHSAAEVGAHDADDDHAHQMEHVGRSGIQIGGEVHAASIEAIAAQGRYVKRYEIERPFGRPYQNRTRAGTRGTARSAGWGSFVRSVCSRT